MSFGNRYYDKNYTGRELWSTVQKHRFKMQTSLGSIIPLKDQFKASILQILV